MPVANHSQRLAALPLVAHLSRKGVRGGRFLDCHSLRARDHHRISSRPFVRLMAGHSGQPPNVCCTTWAWERSHDVFSLIGTWSSPKGACAGGSRHAMGPRLCTQDGCNGGHSNCDISLVAGKVITNRGSCKAQIPRLAGWACWAKTAPGMSWGITPTRQLTPAAHVHRRRSSHHTCCPAPASTAYCCSLTAWSIHSTLSSVVTSASCVSSYHFCHQLCSLDFSSILPSHNAMFCMHARC